MTINDPYLLAAGLIVVALLAWAARVTARRRTAALAAAGVAAPAGGKRAGGKRRRGLAGGIWLTVAGLGVLAVAASGPAVTVPVSHASGTVILAVDVSGSMAATDVTPSRLGAAKRAASSFISAQPSSVEIGVVAFQQGGLETAVPSADHTTALGAVGRLAPGGGTSLGDAILAALTAITHKTVSLGANGAAPSIGYWPSATIVVFSDGGSAGTSSSGGGGATGTSASAAAAVAEKAGVHIDTVGVGTTTGTTIAVDGYHLFTALDPAALQSIAKATGGSYHPASDASELNGIASSINLRLTVTREPLPLAGALILAALVLLAAGGVLTLTRTGRVI
jgi:Ca-activated chloride channel family protein